MGLALQKRSALEMATTTRHHSLALATLDRGLGSTQENAAKVLTAARMRPANMVIVDLMA